MSQAFAEIVEVVKQLSLAEKGELQEILRKYLIEERRAEIRDNLAAGLKEYQEGNLQFFTNTDEMRDSLGSQ